MFRSTKLFTNPKFNFNHNSNFNKNSNFNNFNFNQNSKFNYDKKHYHTETISAKPIKTSSGDKFLNSMIVGMYIGAVIGGTCGVLDSQSSSSYRNNDTNDIILCGFFGTFFGGVTGFCYPITLPIIIISSAYNYKINQKEEDRKRRK